MTSSVGAADAVDQRTRILDMALELMSERGAADTSMRRLAAACDLNVATLYHYFPSKADLLRSVIADRRYFESLAEDDPVMDADLSPANRLGSLLTWLADAAAAEESLIRLVVGESLRRDPEASDTVAELLSAMDGAVARWIRMGLAELDVDVEALARVIRTNLVGLLVQELAVPSSDRQATHRRWADDLVEVALG